MRVNIGKMLLLAVVASFVIAGCGNREPEKSVGQLQQEGSPEMTDETKKQSVAQETESTTGESIKETAKETAQETQTIKEKETTTKEQVTVEIASETQAPTEAVTEKPTETQFSLKDFVLNNRFYSPGDREGFWYIRDFKENNICVLGMQTPYVDYMEEMKQIYRIEGNNLIIIPPTVIPEGSTETVSQSEGYVYEYVASERAFRRCVTEIDTVTGEKREFVKWICTYKKEEN